MRTELTDDERIALISGIMTVLVATKVLDAQSQSFMQVIVPMAIERLANMPDETRQIALDYYKEILDKIALSFH